MICVSRVYKNIKLHNKIIKRTYFTLLSKHNLCSVRFVFFFGIFWVAVFPIFGKTNPQLHFFCATWQLFWHSEHFYKICIYIYGHHIFESVCNVNEKLINREELKPMIFSCCCSSTWAIGPWVLSAKFPARFH